MNNETILIGTNVKMYGEIQFGSNIIIEDNVIIGHPSPVEVANIYDLIPQYQSLDELYHIFTITPTTIGSNSIIRSGSIIYSGCKIGNRFDCGHNVLIREFVNIGNEVYIKPYTHIMTNVAIGNYCRIAGIIADYTTIGDNVSSFGTLTHRRLRRYTDYKTEITKSPKEIGPTVADNCVIGRNAIIVGNINIGQNSTIGANTFVNFNVPANSKVFGEKGINYNNE